MGKDPFPRRHPDTAFRAIGDEGGLVVLPSDAEVKVINNDTDVAPWDVGVHASRTTFIGGNSARLAARKAREKLLAEARRDIEAFIGDLEANGMLDVAENAGETR